MGKIAKKTTRDICLPKLRMIFFVVFLTLPLGGCDSISDWLLEQRYSGSFKGAAACVRSLERAGSSQAAARSSCGAKHQRPTFVELQGRAGYILDGDEFSGTLTNKTPNFIVTSFSLIVKHVDNPNPDYLNIYGVWIEPHQTYQFSMRTNFRPPRNRLRADTNPPLFTWELNWSYGLKLN
jgi:hypothetical protein